ncbi:MAG: CHASE2 domain-containing protein [Waterburya sp.]
MTNPKFNNKLKRLRDILVIAFCACALAIAATYLGLFQNIEWLTLDQWFRLRPIESKDSRITVVTISDSDLRQLRQWPISDTILSQLITKINQQQPRVIGLDIYRDFPVEPGVEELANVLRSAHNVIGVEKVIGTPISSLPILEKQEQTALADLLVDKDGKVRRGLLSIRLKNGEVKLGLATRLALMYLAEEGIQLEPVKNSYQRSLGQATFTSLKSNDGGYINADTGGFQILLNFRGTEDSFDQISMLDVLNGKIPPDLMRDRLVLVGSVAHSLNDFFATPYSKVESEYLPGIFIHANLTSQIINEALEGRTALKTINEPLEWLWVFAWTSGGSIFTWTILSRNSLLNRDLLSLVRSTALCLVLPEAILLGSSYLLFLSGWWLPAITAGFSLVFSTITVSSYYNQSQKKLVYIDGLTQIPNRRYFDLYLQQQWQQCQKNGQYISLILCDIDYFKKYNDTYGHQAGDMCLKQVAQAIYKTARANDLAARYGGEEFVIVLSNTDAKSALTVAARIGKSVRSQRIPHSSSQVSKYVSLSCGVVSTSMSNVSDPEQLILIADQALYQAKEQGRDRAILADGKTL